MSRKRRWRLFRRRRRVWNRDDRERIRWCIAITILVICLLTVPSAVRQPARAVVRGGLYYGSAAAGWIARQM